MSLPLAVLAVVLGNAVYDTLWLIFLGDGPDDRDDDDDGERNPA